MKRTIIFLLLFGMPYSLLSQTKMLTNKNNGTTDSLLLSDVKSISFKSDSSKLSHTKILISKNNGTIDSLWFSDVKSISFKSVSSISNDMVQVAGGTFTAGSTLVTISNFKIDKYEVTYELWTDVRNWGLNNGYTDLPVGSNGFNPVGSNNSVTRVKWYDIVKWCNARSQKDGQTPVYYTDNTQSMVYRIGQIDINIDAVKWNANGYRLPTEAEWEFAARGGTISQGYTYSGSSTVDNVAWYDSNSGNTTHTVGTKSANELGIYDMSGNVWEWCWDWHGSAYPSGGTSDPRGPSTTQSYRMLRGGSFYSNEYHCRVDLRLNDFPDVRYTDPDDYGFRCVHN